MTKETAIDILKDVATQIKARGCIYTAFDMAIKCIEEVGDKFDEEQQSN